MQYYRVDETDHSCPECGGAGTGLLNSVCEACQGTGEQLDEVIGWDAGETARMIGMGTAAMATVGAGTAAAAYGLHKLGQKVGEVVPKGVKKVGDALKKVKKAIPQNSGLEVDGEPLTEAVSDPSKLHQVEMTVTHLDPEEIKDFHRYVGRHYNVTAERTGKDPLGPRFTYKGTKAKLQTLIKTQWAPDEDYYLDKIEPVAEPTTEALSESLNDKVHSARGHLTLMLLHGLTGRTGVESGKALNSTLDELMPHFTEHGVTKQELLHHLEAEARAKLGGAGGADVTRPWERSEAAQRLPGYSPKVAKAIGAVSSKSIGESLSEADAIPGGTPTPKAHELAAKYNLSEDEFEELVDAGVTVELEHTDNEEVARQIALDHLAEDKDYYAKLEKMESGSKDQAGQDGESEAKDDDGDEAEEGEAEESEGGEASEPAGEEDEPDLFRKFESKDEAEGEALTEAAKTKWTNAALRRTADELAAAHVSRYADKLAGLPEEDLERHVTDFVAERAGHLFDYMGNLHDRDAYEKLHELTFERAREMHQAYGNQPYYGKEGHVFKDNLNVIGKLINEFAPLTDPVDAEELALASELCEDEELSEGQWPQHFAVAYSFAKHLKQLVGEQLESLKREKNRVHRPDSLLHQLLLKNPNATVDDAMAEIHRRNQTPAAKREGWDAAHEAVDANMAMQDAIEQHTGEKFDYDKHAQLWNMAWDHALERGLYRKV